MVAMMRAWFGIMFVVLGCGMRALFALAGSTILAVTGLRPGSTARQG
ncbi:hypothetical protein [Streptomyces chartreusis]